MKTVLSDGRRRRAPAETIDGALDPLDRRLVQILAKDGRMSVGRMAKSLGITPPTVRSRIGGLLSSQLVRISGLVDPTRTGELTIALVGICLENHKQLDQKLEEISQLKCIHWAAVVTGHFDIMAEIVTAEGMTGLYRFLTNDLSRVGGIRSSESYVVMKAKRKWVLLPDKDEGTEILGKT